MRKIIKIIVCLIMMFGFSTNESFVGFLGNKLNINLSNVAYAEPSSDWFCYLHDIGDSESLWKMKTDGTNDQKITDTDIHATNFMLSGDGWLYYIHDTSSTDSLWKMKIDGMNDQKITYTDIHATNFMLSGDGWLYYIHDTSSTDSLWKMKIDGTNDQKITDTDIHATNFMLSGDGWLYYIHDTSSTDSLWKMKIDGTNDQKITYTDIHATNFMLSGDGWLYYIHDTESADSLWKMKIDGTNDQKITDTDIHATNFMLSGDGWLYYIHDTSSTDSLWKMKIDGTNDQKVTDTDIHANNFMLYTNKYPVIYPVNPDQTNVKVFCETDTAFQPIINVYDANGDNLTCKVFIDSETTPRSTKLATNTTTNQQIIFNAVNVAALSENTHTIKYEAYDGFDTAQNTVSFKVDKTAPVINASAMSISSTTTGLTASINPSYITEANPHSSSPYKYTIIRTADNSIISTSGWTASTQYLPSPALAPNTQYTVKLEVRDVVNHTSYTTKNIYTKASIPIITASNIKATTLDVSATENNPSNTEYLIQAGSKYVASSGSLSTTPTWITLTNKKITVTGLSENTLYAIKAKARNRETTPVETTFCSTVNVTTLHFPPAVPTNLQGVPSTNSVTLSWNVVSDTDNYEIECNGTVIDSSFFTIYTHEGITTNTPYTYRVRARNNGGPSEWSEDITKWTTPSSPDIPNIIDTTPTSDAITISWNDIDGSSGYDIEADGVVINNNLETTYLHNGLYPNTQHNYRVRSRNAGGKSEWSAYTYETTKDTAPDVPTNIKTSATLDAITVTWDIVENANCYDIEINDSQEENVTVPQYVYGGLEPGSECTFRIKACNSEGESDWSAAVTKSTLSEETIPGKPIYLTAEPTDDSIKVIWDRVDGAENYDLEMDDSIIDNVTVTEYVYGGLEPDTIHTFRLRGVNNKGSGEWSEPFEMCTLPYTIAVPNNLRAEAGTNEIRVLWDEVGEAEGYDIEVDGINDSITQAVYDHTGLQSNIQHTYRVRTRVLDGVSGWSDSITISTMSALPQVLRTPTNLTAQTNSTSIKVLWYSVRGATSYEIEMDNQSIGNATVTQYTCGGLQSNATHTFRVKAKNPAGVSVWSAPLTATAVSNVSGVPGNVRAVAEETSITVAWDAVLNAIGYQILVDGNLVSTGTSRTYKHLGLGSSTNHTYRVRALIGSAAGQWSQTLTVSTSHLTYQVPVDVGEKFNLVLTASDLSNFNNISFNVTYNPLELEVVDLSSITSAEDTAVGLIPGTNITIVEYTAGKIVFKVNKTVPAGQTWSGIVNYMKFKAKVSGNKSVGYTIN